MLAPRSVLGELDVVRQKIRLITIPSTFSASPVRMGWHAQCYWLPLIDPITQKQCLPSPRTNMKSHPVFYCFHIAAISFILNLHSLSAQNSDTSVVDGFPNSISIEKAVQLFNKRKQSHKLAEQIRDLTVQELVASIMAYRVTPGVDLDAFEDATAQLKNQQLPKHSGIWLVAGESTLSNATKERPDSQRYIVPMWRIKYVQILFILGLEGPTPDGTQNAEIVPKVIPIRVEGITSERVPTL